MTDYCVCVGRHAKDLRLTQELTRKQLSEKALISVGTIERIEAGVPVTKLITLVNLARGLGVTPTFLFTPPKWTELCERNY